MKGCVVNIEKASKKNPNFRHVLYTAKHSQLVLMSLKPGEDIGEETHDLDQFIRVEQGSGKAILGQDEHTITDGSAIVIPAGTKHNIINDSGGLMKLYTIYSPPEHRDGVTHATKSEALTDETDEFNGETTEK